MADTEDYFPRGGKKPVVHQFNKSSNFLGAPEREQKKKKKPKARPEPEDDGYLSDEARKTESGSNLAIGLSYKTAKPGTIILGRVRQVLETKMHISLPGLMIGTVMACHISEPYNKLLEAYVNDLVDKVRDLSDMFRPGQYVAVKVLEARDHSVMLSMMPQHLYEGKRKPDFTSGFLLQAAVSSVEDHGYVMDVGVPNVRAFMAQKDTNPEIQLEPGMLTWCCVTSSSEASMSLSSTLEALRSGVQRKSSSLLPASNVRFAVHKPLDNGIEGLVFGARTACILWQHAGKVDGKRPAIGQKFNARVLYVMPTRNTPFLTMRDIFESARPDLDAEQTLNEGDIVEEAQVMKVVGRTIRFKLRKGIVGVLSGKRVQVDEDFSDEQVLAKMYPIGSKHKVRILAYNLSDYTYSVSDQPSILNEKYFTMGQLTVGDVVTAAVKTVGDGGATLTIGRFTGFVPHAHMTDAGIFIDPKKGHTSERFKKKFKAGQEVKARVLSVDAPKQNLFLTLKSSLVAPDLEILKSYEEAIAGHQYTGTIKHIREDYILVSFFNHVTAFVPKCFISKEPIDKLFDAFHVGQIVKCRIIHVNPDTKKITGSFLTEPFTPGDKNNLKTKKRKVNDVEDDIALKNKKDKKDKMKETGDDESDIQESKKKKDKKDKTKQIGEVEEDILEGKKKKDKKHNTDIVQEETNVKDTKGKKDKKSSLSEESDAIETDIHTEEEVLTPSEQGLVDFSDCVTEKQWKKRILSLIRCIKVKSKRFRTVDKKIKAIEQKGLNVTTKKFHTAMHMEKLVIEQRSQKLIEVLKIAQEKLKEFRSTEENENKTVQKNKRKEKKEGDKLQKTETKKEEKVKVKRKEIEVVEDLKPVLEVPSAKEFWSASVDTLSQKVQEDESSSSDEEEKEQPKKKRKKLTVAEKVAKARAEEDRVREMERRAIESEHQPRSSDQFERALLASPGCSQLWIAYMAFHLQATEIDKARAVARKALNTIPFREEHEKLNVWVALLNCEHRFGTKETQQKTLEDAIQTNEPFHVHCALLDILLETGKQQELSSLVDAMLRRYRTQPAMYTRCGGACYRAGLVDKARQVMQKAVAVLEKKEHVSVLVQFALMERSADAPERAEALFEQVLAVYPARTDVCNVYVDMLVKSGDIAPVRQVMERMTSHKLPARKMKVLFKKWIEVEEKIGDKEQVEVIRQRAAEYIDKAKF